MVSSVFYSLVKTINGDNLWRKKCCLTCSAHDVIDDDQYQSTKAEVSVYCIIHDEYL